ncbi:MAG: glycosyltransferase family 39 protein [Vicinamibacterales bacterium]
MKRLLLAAYAFAILSIGLTADWRLRHEDNGAMHTTLALSHLELGLAGTRAHDVFVNATTGERRPYGHHPPATALLLAGAFAVTGSDAPAVARLTVIAFHIGSVLLMVELVGALLGEGAGWLGGGLMATLPMSGYFGRMVNYEPLCLFAVIVQVLGYVRYKQHGRRRDLALAAAGIVWGGLIDWPSFFFAAALGAVETLDVVSGRSRGRALLGVLVCCSAGVFALDIWHLWYAGRASMQALGTVLGSNDPLWSLDATPSRFLLGQLDTFRRYFTEVGLISTLLVSWSLARPGSAAATRLFAGVDDRIVRRVLASMFGAAVAYQLAAPRWAMMHQYWQFYFLPPVVLSIVLAWRRLERAWREHPSPRLRALQVVCVLDVLIASGYWLHFRHTRPESYAIETTASFRSLYLAPKSSPGADRSIP